ncbi:MAG: hypothetical protein K2X81_12930 [Candidatus Obscuribacterales bacterium]|nr:hypothetical protein [Candidatus Obscuribacterales bacterium]
MSNNSLDSVDTTLRDLKDIVDRNHPESLETSLLMQDMAKLIAQMKTKTRNTAYVANVIIDSSPAIGQTTVLSALA